MSSGQVWFMSSNATLTSTISPDSPETLIVEGYGVAAASSLMVIAAGLANTASSVRASRGSTFKARWLSPRRCRARPVRGRDVPVEDP